MSVEVRCVRVSQSANLVPGTKQFRELKADKLGLEEPRLQWPAFGYSSFNMAMQTKYELPKREDEINERSLLAGIGYERYVRYEKVQEVTPWLKKGYNFIEIGKCKEDSEKTDTFDTGVYACAVYLCKKIRPFEVLE